MKYPLSEEQVKRSLDDRRFDQKWRYSLAQIKYELILSKKKCPDLPNFICQNEATHCSFIATISRFIENKEWSCE